MHSQAELSWPGMDREENPKNPRAGKRPQNTTQFLGNPAAQFPGNPGNHPAWRIPQQRQGRTGWDSHRSWDWEQNSIGTLWMEATPRLPGLPGNFMGFLQAPVSGNSPYPRNPEFPSVIPCWIRGIQDSQVPWEHIPFPPLSHQLI